MKTNNTTPTATAMSVAFTGHRTIRPEHVSRIKSLLATAIIELYERGYHVFYSGMAIGFDLLAAETIIDLKAICPQMRLVAAIPFPGQEQRYSDRDKQRYHAALAAADESYVLAPRFSGDAYRRRNAYLVEHGSVLVAYYDAADGMSGTGQTVRMAERRGRNVWNLFARL